MEKMSKCLNQCVSRDVVDGLGKGLVTIGQATTKATITQLQDACMSFNQEESIYPVEIM